MILKGVALVLTSGFANLQLMNSSHQVPEACQAACNRLHIAPTKHILTVNISLQTASLFENGAFVKRYPCSTSRFGIGQLKGSN